MTPITLSQPEVKQLAETGAVEVWRELLDFAQVQYEATAAVRDGYATIESVQRYTPDIATPENPVGSPIESVGLPAPFAAGETYWAAEEFCHWDAVGRYERLEMVGVGRWRRADEGLTHQPPLNRRGRRR